MPLQVLKALPTMQCSSFIHAKQESEIIKIFTQVLTRSNLLLVYNRPLHHPTQCRYTTMLAPHTNRLANRVTGFVTAQWCAPLMYCTILFSVPLNSAYVPQYMTIHSIHKTVKLCAPIYDYSLNTINNM